MAWNVGEHIIKYESKTQQYTHTLSSSRDNFSRAGLSLKITPTQRMDICEALYMTLKKV